MKVSAIFVGLFMGFGFLLVGTSIRKSHIAMTELIAPYVGLPIKKSNIQLHIFDALKRMLTNGGSAPWASDKRISMELRRCASEQTLVGFRLEQLVFASLGTLLVSLWLVLRIASGNAINPAFGLILVPASFIGGGGFRSWLLKETSRKRIKEIEVELPSILDLLAFAVSAGEPVITAMQRVALSCSGELSIEIRRLTSGLAVGDNFLASLDRLHRELGSQSLSRAIRALVMAIERGTPIADVLRAQAMDARNLEARKLMILAGKKETLMMVPVVFLILPMIVVVALYPGLLALKTF